MKRFSWFFPIFVMAVICPSGPSWGQGLAELELRIQDPSKAVLEAAAVTLTAGDRAWQAVSDIRGRAVFGGLLPGVYRLTIEKAGFQSLQLPQLTLKAGRRRIDVRLKLAVLEEEVVVQADERAPRSAADGFSTYLSPDQIAQLPDDPEEFERALKELAGPGAVIQVDGFSGGRLPPKSQIRDIRIQMSPFSAEYHDPGFAMIHVNTNPGQGQWAGNLNFGFRDEALNARNAFSPQRGPEQTRRLALDLSGPLWKDRTSLFLSAEGDLTYDSRTLLAALPEGITSRFFQRPSRLFGLTSRVVHNLSASHTLRAEWQKSSRHQNGLGVGEFSLPERAYSTRQEGDILRMSETGTFGRRLLNELRLQLRRQEVEAIPHSDDPAVIVLDSFQTGGAQRKSDRGTRDLQLRNDVSFSWKRHAVKAGVSWEEERFRSDELINAGGTFVFSSLAAFQAGRPTVYTQRVGDPHLRFAQRRLGFFVQDDIKVHSRFSLSLGLRQELQTQLEDHRNLAPRLGWAWSPFRGGKTTVRGGAGIFYTWFDPQLLGSILRVDGHRQREIVVRTPGFPDPFQGGSIVVLPTSRIQTAPNLQMPAVLQLAGGLERQLGSSLRAQMNYRFQRGNHLFRSRNVNAPLPGPGRPDPGAGNITQLESSASSWMHMLTLGLSRFSERFSLSAYYMLSRLTNETDDALSLPADNFNLKAERGPAAHDARHRFSSMLTLRLCSDIRLTALVNASSAGPYTITTGFDDNGDTVVNDRPAGVGRNSARGGGRFESGARLSWSKGFGRRPESAAGGTLVRMIQGGEGMNFPTTSGAGSSRVLVEFYIQAFNLLNHANLTQYTGVQTSPFFGRPTAAQPPRRLETGLRISF